jgi:hypothetical protein
MNALLSHLIAVAHAENGLSQFFQNHPPTVPLVQFNSSIGLDPYLNALHCSAIPNGTFLGCYIAALYSFFVQGAIVLAVVMIMFGGFQWLLAAGNSSKISEAKSTISAAIFGLILALTSYLLFAQINNKLVDLEDLDIKPVPVTVLPQQTMTPGTSPGARVTCGDYTGVALDATGNNRVVLTASDVNAAQLSTLSQPLANGLLALDQALAKIPNFPPVRITSITDDHIFSGTCSRIDGVNTPLSADESTGCQHATRSAHYGGDLYYCQNFDQKHPPISCAADLAFEKNLSQTLKSQYYPILWQQAQAAGLTGGGCEPTGSHVWVDCTRADIEHVHAETTGCVSR